MVEKGTSGEKRRKEPIRNVPKGFKNAKEYIKETKGNVSGQTEEKVKEPVKADEVSSKQKTEEIFSPASSDNKAHGDSKHHSLREYRNKLIAVSVVAAVVLLVFVFKPNILGLGVYDEGELNDTLNNLAGTAIGEEDDKYSIDDLGSTIEQLKLEISSGNSKLSEFLENDINSITDDLIFCQREKASLEDTYDESISSLEDELDEKNQELDSLKAEKNTQCTELESKFTSLENSFDLLALNSAKSICCKQKVDNFDIDYYDVINDKIVCLEEGNKSLNCFS